MSIGKNIKKYRTQKGMTQRELAEAIGVSVQAISKWECGATPDISQILPLAAALDISHNMLLGYTDRYAQLDRGWHEMIRKYAEGSFEIIEYEREALREYPNDAVFLFRLASDLRIHAQMSQDEKEKIQYLEMSKKQYLVNLSIHPDFESNREGLVEVYMDLGMKEEALKCALESKRKDLLLKLVYKGEELVAHRQMLIDKNLKGMIGEMLPYKNVEVWRIAKNIIKAAIPDGNYQRYGRFLYMLDFRIANYCEESGDYEGAVAAFRDSLERCKAENESEKGFTTPLLDRMPSDREFYEFDGETKTMMIDKGITSAEWVYKVMTGEYWTEAGKTELVKREDYKEILAELEQIIFKNKNQI